MSGYQLPPVPSGALANRLKANRRQPRAGNILPVVSLPPDMKKRAQAIANETKVSPDLVMEVYAKGLASGATDAGVCALARSGMLDDALKKDFSWNDFNALVRESEGQEDTLRLLIGARITADEAIKMDVSDPNVRDGLEVLDMLK